MQTLINYVLSHRHKVVLIIISKYGKIIAKIILRNMII